MYTDENLKAMSEALLLAMENVVIDEVAHEGVIVRPLVNRERARSIVAAFLAETAFVPLVGRTRDGEWAWVSAWVGLTEVCMAADPEPVDEEALRRDMESLSGEERGALEEVLEVFERFDTGKDRSPEAGIAELVVDVIMEPPAKASAVYFIQSVGGGLIKIGQSIDPPSRLADLQTGSPVELRLLATSESMEERDLHVTFADDRAHGEWFRPTPKLLSLIESINQNE